MQHATTSNSSAARNASLAKLATGNPALDVGPLPINDSVKEIALAPSFGTNRTGMVLAYGLYELARHQQWYERLRFELSTFRSRPSP